MKLTTFQCGDYYYVSLQPHFEEYTLVRYMDYALCFPWIRENNHVFFAYDHTVAHPSKDRLPTLERLGLLCLPFPMKGGMIDSDVVQIATDLDSCLAAKHFALQSNVRFSRALHAAEPLLAEIGETTLVYDSKYGHTSVKPVKSQDVRHLPHSEIVHLVNLHHVLAVVLCRRREIDPISLFGNVVDEYDLHTLQQCYMISKDIAMLSGARKVDPPHYIVKHGDLQPSQAVFVNRNTNKLILHSCKVVEVFEDTFEKHGLIANCHGWMACFEFMLEDLYSDIGFVDRPTCQIEFEESEITTARFAEEEELKVFHDYLVALLEKPPKIEEILQRIPASQREKYFPVNPHIVAVPGDLDDDEEEEDIVEVDFESSFLSLWNVSTGKEEIFQIDLDVEGLFDQFNGLFEKHDAYANGDGWYDLVRCSFYPHRAYGDLDGSFPLFDPEASGLIISFSSADARDDLAGRLEEMLKDEQKLEAALKDLER